MNKEEDIRQEEEVAISHVADAIPSGEDAADLTEDDIIVGGDRLI